MKFATLEDGTRDGRLVVVSSDLARMAAPAGDDLTMQDLVETWDARYDQLAAVDLSGAGSESFDPRKTLAPLPRAWQWLDGSAFQSHGDLMQHAYDMAPLPRETALMYQGMSHRFLAGHVDVAFPSEAHGIDFEAEFAVIVDDVPMGTSADQALSHVKLVLLLNDWSLRVLAMEEMRTGFGWVRAKPACSVAPVAVTPDELGDAWSDGRIHLPVYVDYAGRRFGEAQGGAMGFGFHELIAHAAATRDLCAGTIIGSGTVSNANYRDVGSSCIAERRAIEKLDTGAPQTPFMRFGDTVRIEILQNGRSMFGAIDQRVTAVA